MGLHLVLGKGPAGAATARLLAQEGHRVRVVSRTGGAGGPDAGAIDHIALDITSASELMRVARDAEAIYNCAAPPYHRWVKDWPALAAAVNATAEATGAVLVSLSNLYPYGPVDGLIAEHLPLRPAGPKAAVRALVWRQAKELHDQGQIRVVEARASDFFGPGVTDGGHLAGRVVPAVLRRRSVQVVGDPDAPHSWTYVPDVARALVRLARDETAWGRAWHVPTAQPHSSREMIGLMARQAGVPAVPVRQVPQAAFSLLGLFSPLLRELREVRYQFDRPFVVDSSAYSAQFDDTATAVDQQIAATITWWSNRISAATSG